MEAQNPAFSRWSHSSSWIEFLGYRWCQPYILDESPYTQRKEWIWKIYEDSYDIISSTAATFPEHSLKKNLKKHNKNKTSLSPVLQGLKCHHPEGIKPTKHIVMDYVNFMTKIPSFPCLSHRKAQLELKDQNFYSCSAHMNDKSILFQK